MATRTKLAKSVLSDYLPGMSKKEQWDLYRDYLQLDKVLDAQHLWSDDAGHPAHDEMLFIVFHQIYELWFKQILFEMDDIQKRFSAHVMNDRDIQPILSHLNRIAEIFKIMVQQLDVLETMTPQNFVDFREHLRTATGFQSWQFRLIETRLGLKRDDRIPVFHCPFDDKLTKESQDSIRDAESRPSLHEQIDEWLARTPFIDWDDYRFRDSYQSAIQTMMDERKAYARDNLSGDALESELQNIERSKNKFDSIFDPDKHKAAQENGTWRMSLKALQAALFIKLYRHEPALQMPSRLLTLIMDIDSLMAQWRFRHALMAQRMVGTGAGTGGSSGYGYLLSTAEKHRIYTDLFSLSGFLVPTRTLSDLPDSICAQLGYRYNTEKAA